MNVTPSVSISPPQVPTKESAGVGANVPRPDGLRKATGSFVYASDLQAEGMLFGVTLRSPHPHARIRAIDIGPALEVPGVSAVLTYEDIPGSNEYGLEVADQPVLAADRVRYKGEAVALVAADRLDTARYALDLIKVDYEPIAAVTDAATALEATTPSVHDGGNLVRHAQLRHGPQDAVADVVVHGEYEVGMQDQAFLGPESALALPDEEGGIELYCSTQWLHVDQTQLAHILGLPKDKVRLVLSGVGGAFGGREDLSVQAHASLLALKTGRPIKMSYGREESFYGHVHRHPARMRYEHGATSEGKLVYVRAQILLDGGAYASTSRAVLGNATYFAAGPYEVPSVTVESDVVYTNNPPCGAMRGFGAVQVCFGYESQMDKLAAALDVHPVDIRQRNAMTTGSTAATGQRVNGPAPVGELLQRVREAPLPSREIEPDDPYGLPGGVANVTHGEGIQRGVGYAISIKNIAKSAGYDDYSTARIRLSMVSGVPQVEVHTAAAEVGQGLVTVLMQIARTELGVHDVVLHAADTDVGDAGTSSASRQTWMTGGAVKGACELLRTDLLEHASLRTGWPSADLRISAGAITSGDANFVIGLDELVGTEVYERTHEFHHRITDVPDPETGQGDAHVAFAFAAHRAIVDVDVELGLVRVVEIATAQDVGKAMNPQAIIGQINGGISQGLGLALMEEIQVRDGLIQNPSFTDYLIPTFADMPPVRTEILETPHPDAPYGLTGVGEPPMISSPAAVAAAVRDATGLSLERIPVHPEHLCPR